MKRVEVTEYVDGGEDKVYEADYFGRYEEDGRIIVVFALDNGDLKLIDLSVNDPAAPGDFRFL